MAKLFAGELLNKVADHCLQSHGGFGYIEEFPISRAWRDVAPHHHRRRHHRDHEGDPLEAPRLGLAFRCTAR